MSSSILIKHADYIVTMNPTRKILRDGAIYVVDNRIVEVGETADLSSSHPTADQVLDGSGMAVYPGLVNTHTHLFQVLLKGLGDDRILIDWLKTIIFPSTRKLEHKHLQAAALLGSVEAIKSGTTTTLDFNYPAPQLSEAVVSAFQMSGIRGIVGCGVIDCGEDIGLPSEIIRDPDATFKEIRRLKQLAGVESRIYIWLAPVAVWGVTEDALRSCRTTADELGIGITIHVSETPFELQNCQTRFHCREMELFQKTGLLGPDLLAVHCVHFDDRDIAMARPEDVKISHNAVSNMYLSSGIAPVPRMLANGVTVGLGVDGAASNNNQDMLQLIKITALLHKVANPGRPTVITAEKVLEMATIDGARAIGLQNEIGSLQEGKKADMILVDLGATYVSPAHNPISALVYSATSESVVTSIIDGKIIMKDRQLIGLNEREIVQAARAASQDLIDKSGIVD